MKHITRDYITGIFVFLFSLFYLVMTISIRKAPIGGAHAPKVYPLMLAIGGIICALFLLAYTRIKAQKKIESTSTEASDEYTGDINEIKMLLKIGITTTLFGLGFAFLFEKLGYLISISLLLAGFMFLINGKKSWKLNIITPIIFSVCSFLIFATLLSVPLPLFLDL